MTIWHIENTYQEVIIPSASHYSRLYRAAADEDASLFLVPPLGLKVGRKGTRWGHRMVAAISGVEERWCEERNTR